MTKKLRVDSFSAYLASDTDLPFEVWLRERDELARNRVKKPEPMGWAPTLLVAIVLACMLLTLCVVITAMLKGPA